MEQLRGNRWITLLLLCIGFLMILVDTTIVNVSIPTIIKDLGASLSDIEWIISGYALTFAAFLITFGRLGDMYGRKNFFLGGLAVFTIASYFSGQATSPDSLIVARLFQGVGGAMISPSTLSIISTTFRGKERAIAFGIWGAVAGLAVALGPVLGGYFSTYQNWRWIFYVNIPIGIIGILLGALIIQETNDHPKHKLDWAGMITSTIGFFLLVFGLIEGQNYGWIAPKKDFVLGSFTWNNPDLSIILPAIILGIIFLVIFLFIQLAKTRRGTEPAVNITFFQSRAFSYGLITIAVLALGEFSSLFTVPIFLQSLRGYTPIQSGVATLPLAIAVLIAAPTSAQIVNRLGTKWVISLGIFFEFLGLFLLSRLTVDTTAVQLIIPFFILGAGIGLAIAQNTQATLSEIPHQNSGSASGVLNTIRQVGTAFGIAIIGAVLASRLTANLKTEIDTIPNLPDQVKQQIVDTAAKASTSYQSNQNTGYVLEVPVAIRNNPTALIAFTKQQAETQTEIKAAVARALAKSISQAIEVGALFVLLGALLSLLMPNIKTQHE